MVSFKTLFITLALFTACSTCAAESLYIFSASWCPPCRRLKSFLVQDKDIKKQYDITYIDIDKFPELSKKYRVKSVPTTIILEEGTEMRRIVGYNSGYKTQLINYKLEKLKND